MILKTIAISASTRLDYIITNKNEANIRSDNTIYSSISDGKIDNKIVNLSNSKKMKKSLE